MRTAYFKGSRNGGAPFGANIAIIVSVETTYFYGVRCDYSEFSCPAIILKWTKIESKPRISIIYILVHFLIAG